MLRSADELLGPALAETLGHLTLADEDAALVKLATRYAAAIDRAAKLAAEADAIADGLDPGDLPGRQRLALLAAKVDSQAVLGNLGPKLLQALAALQATPQARVRRRGGGGDRAGPNRLEELRQARR